MKLLYITNAIHGSGGLERVLSIKASYLVENLGYEVEIVTLNSSKESLFYNFSPKIKISDVSVYGAPIVYLKRYIQELVAVVNKSNPDIIMVCDDGLKGFLLPIIFKKSRVVVYERHVSKLIEMHHDFSFIKKSVIKLKWLLMDTLAKNFNAFVVLTEGNRKEWSGLKNLKVISNPLSFYPEASSSLVNKKVISVGKHSYQKGYDLLLKSWALVNKKHPHWTLEIYGKRESAMGLEELAKDLNIESAISFNQPEQMIEQKYLESSIYVMSSRFEGFGMVLIEAMACGVPCVSFNCNYGPSDIITNNEDGYIVAEQNHIALAEKIIFLIEDQSLRQAMGSKAKENVKRYLPSIVLHEWDNLFKNLVR